MFHSGFQVKIVEGPGRGQVIPLDSREVTLGRALNPGDRAPGFIYLYEDTVSRVHAQLIWDETARQYVLHHRSQTNPTTVNGVPAEDQPVPLNANDHIELGKMVLQIQAAERRWSAQALEDARLQQQAPPESRSPLASAVAARPGIPVSARPVRSISMGAPPAQPTRAAWVVRVLRGVDAGRTFPIQGTVAVGSEAVVRLQDDSLQPEHAILRWNEPDQRYQVLASGGDCRVERDMDGLTWAAALPQGQRLTLHAGDRLLLGETLLEMALESDSALEEPDPQPDSTEEAAPAPEAEATEASEPADESFDVPV
ncbi:MAG: FHA domain-containing protein [Candidatus Eremiobacterota bacterium]